LQGLTLGFDGIPELSVKSAFGLFTSQKSLLSMD
jgi:hypothetical protein